MIVVGIENDEIALFTYFDTSNTVGSLTVSYTHLTLPTILRV